MIPKQPEYLILSRRHLKSDNSDNTSLFNSKSSLFSVSTLIGCMCRSDHKGGIWAPFSQHSSRAGAVNVFRSEWESSSTFSSDVSSLVFVMHFSEPPPPGWAAKGSALPVMTTSGNLLQPFHLWRGDLHHFSKVPGGNEEVGVKHAPINTCRI